MARLMIVSVSHHLLVQMISQGYETHVLCIEGLPEDAELVGSAHDPNSTVGVLLKFRHESFEDVPTGLTIPWFLPKFVSHHRGEDEPDPFEEHRKET